MRVPTGRSAAELEVKRSRFIADAVPLSAEEQVRALVSERHERYAGCSHVVYAYVYGEHAERFGMTDDGEPKGTAGRPVLEVVKGSGITNLAVFVVRYFGGTKLGTGGLVRAYTRAAQMALQDLPSEELIRRLQFEMEIGYSAYEKVRRLVDELGGSVSDESFATDVAVRGLIPADARDEFVVRVGDITNGRSVPDMTDPAV